MDRMAHVDVDQSTVKPHSFQTLSKVFFLQERHAFLKISRQILVRHRNKWNNSSKIQILSVCCCSILVVKVVWWKKSLFPMGFCLKRSWWFFSVSIKTPPTKFQVSTGLSWSPLYLPESQRGTFPVVFFRKGPGMGFVWDGGYGYPGMFIDSQGQSPSVGGGWWWWWLVVRYLQSLRKRLLSVDFFDRIIALQ